VNGWNITAQYTKCKRENCKTCQSGGQHGPYYYGSKSTNGKTERCYFGKELPTNLDGWEDVRDDALQLLKRENQMLRKELTKVKEKLEKMQKLYPVFGSVKVAELLSVSRQAVKTWEKYFNDYITVSRDEFGRRVYPKETFDRFVTIAHMRKKRIHLNEIREIFAIIYDSPDTLEEKTVKKRMITLKTEESQAFRALGLVEKFSVQQVYLSLTDSELELTQAERESQGMLFVGDVPNLDVSGTAGTSNDNLYFSDGSYLEPLALGWEVRVPHFSTFRKNK
jgi:DNA-binding transcriptional MerR regulator